MPTARTNIDRLGRGIVEGIRGQADARIKRNVNEINTGIVVSTDPLQISVNNQGTNRITLGAGEVNVLPTEVIQPGQTVTLVRTSRNDIIALPVVPGYDLRPLTGFTSDPDAGAGDPYSSLAEPTVGGPAGDRVIAKALSYVGTAETGTNTDGGGKIDEWITKSGGSIGQPWCGYFVKSMYREAQVDDEGIAHGYTGTIVSTAQSLGRVKSSPVKGCMAVKGTQHVTLYISGPIHAARCVGGNESNAVSTGVRDLTGNVFCVPEALTQTPPSTSPVGGAIANASLASSRPGRNNPPGGSQR